jgi:hypothetical protein
MAGRGPAVPKRSEIARLLESFAENGHRLATPAASKPNPLHFVLRQPFLGAVIALGRARALLRRHLLRVLQGAAIVELGSDAGCAERVVADRRQDAGDHGAPADHAPGIGLADRQNRCRVSTRPDVRRAPRIRRSFGRSGSFVGQAGCRHGVRREFERLLGPSQ